MIGNRLGGIGPALAFGLASLAWSSAWGQKPARPVVAAVAGGSDRPEVLRVADRRDTVRLSPSQVERLGIKAEPARASTTHGTLVLRGVLALDPSRQARVRPPFRGSVASIGTTTGANGETRPLRAGDAVTRNQILVNIWSYDLSERKNDLLNLLLKLRLESDTFKRIEKLANSGAATKRTLDEDRRELEDAEIDVAQAERSLQARGVTDEEIAAVEAEAKKVATDHKRSTFDPEHSWGRYPLRAPIDGRLIVSDAVTSDLVQDDDLLFVVADLRKLVARVKVPEDDLPEVEELPTPARWTLRADGRPQAAAIVGDLETISPLIDPNDHMATLCGSVDNPDGRLHPGRSIIATIDLPPDPDLVEVPASARLTDAGRDWVFFQPNPDQPVYRLRSVRSVRESPGLFTTRDDPIDGLHPGDRVVVAGAGALKALLDGVVVPADTGH